MTVEQESLFGPPPVHAIDPATSRHAATVAAVTAGALRDRILAYLLRVGDHGATAFECWQACGGKYPHVAGTRLCELERPKGKDSEPLVEKTDRTRRTEDGAGNPAVVWVLTAAGRSKAAAAREAAA